MLAQTPSMQYLFPIRDPRKATQIPADNDEQAAVLVVAVSMIAKYSRLFAGRHKSMIKT